MYSPGGVDLFGWESNRRPDVDVDVEETPMQAKSSLPASQISIINTGGK